MDAGLLIYFLRDPGQNIYFKVFDGQDIYFFKMQAPSSPLRINCSSPNKKKGNSFNHSPIVPTAILNTYPCPTGFGLVIFKQTTP